ncbi:PilN domain-containing protein [Desulfonatronospira sp.]|uniref:PilN domain-containing protein n=1 Tax=Desulfonatronospira sp. TaxID=1962951 RepID=UPI0025C09030|nr:PilN domain-containing protein [Desulfonatronospira sp.]
MIKINLFPHSKRARLKPAEKQIILGLGLVLCISLVCAVLIMWSGNRVSSLEKSVARLEEQRHELLQQVRHNNEIKDKMQQMQSNIRAIKDIRTIQPLPVRYIETLVSNLPDQRIWFESMDLDPDGTLEIRGVVLDNQVFARYVDDLRQSPYVHSVNTRRTSRRQIQDLDLVEFDFRIQAGEPVPGELTLQDSS